MDILNKVNGHDDLVSLTHNERKALCSEIRQFLIESVAATGGHLASNLGVVETAVAIETVYNTSRDRLVFDVGHQSYVHKLLTGRRDSFGTLRQFQGISGFPKPEESDTDSFVAGHASSSVSIALGMARARTLLGENYHVVALLGDGAFTGGMAYEGLNDAAVSHEPMVIILNDNEMSIGKNVGGMSRHLSRVRSSQRYLHAKRYYRQIIKMLPGGRSVYVWSSRLKNRIKHALLAPTVFENMGLTYLGPVDGHDLDGLIALLRSAKEMREPVLVHVVTKKGLGYAPAENNPSRFHGIGKFDCASGKALSVGKETFSDRFGESLVNLAHRNPRICAITAAMPDGTGLTKFAKTFQGRLFDVGIAEEHAVSMAGGLAKQGMVPVVAIYSTFLQRAYDQIVQDIALLKLHVVLAVDRAGLVGDDGPTHHGVFDVGYLSQIPGMLLLAPATLDEQRDMLEWAIEEHQGPVAIRYPRGGEGLLSGSAWSDESKRDVIFHRDGKDILLVTYGVLTNEVVQASDMLAELGIHAGVARFLRLTQLPAEKLAAYLADNTPVVVVEETAAGSGIADRLAYAFNQLCPACRVYGINLGPDFVPHGSIDILRRECGLDAASITAFVKEKLSYEN